MNRRKIRWTVLLLGLATISAAQSFAERNPFQPPPVANEEHPGDMPISGMVCDGERRHYWTIAADGRWRQRDPPAEIIQTHSPSSTVQTQGPAHSPACSAPHIQSLGGPVPGP